MSTRIYEAWPWTSADDFFLYLDPEIGGQFSLRGHAVTEEVLAALGDLDEEEQEYAVMTAAAQESLSMFQDEGETYRRLVVVFDVDEGDVRVVPGGGTRVEVDDALMPEQLVGMFMDGEDAVDDVRAAVLAHGFSRAGSRTSEAERLAERCLDHELQWYAASEWRTLMADAYAVTGR